MTAVVAAVYQHLVSSCANLYASHILIVILLPLSHLLNTRTYAREAWALITSLVSIPLTSRNVAYFDSYVFVIHPGLTYTLHNSAWEIP